MAPMLSSGAHTLFRPVLTPSKPATTVTLNDFVKGHTAGYDVLRLRSHQSHCNRSSFRSNSPKMDKKPISGPLTLSVEQQKFLADNNYLYAQDSNAYLLLPKLSAVDNNIAVTNLVLDSPPTQLQLDRCVNSAIIVHRVWDEKLARFRNISNTETDTKLYEQLVAYQRYRSEKQDDFVLLLQLSYSSKYQVHCSTGYILGSTFYKHKLTVAGKYVKGNFSDFDQADYKNLCADPSYEVVYSDPNNNSDNYIIHQNIVTRHWHQAIAHFNTDTMTMSMLTQSDIDLCKRLYYDIDHTVMNTLGITYHCLVTQELNGINYDGYDSDPYDEVDVATSSQLNVFIFVPYASQVPADIKACLDGYLATLSPYTEDGFKPTVKHDTRPTRPRSINTYRYLLTSYEVVNPTGAWLDLDYVSKLENVVHLNI